MQRRRVFGLAALSAAALAMGLGVANWAPGVQANRLTPTARRLLVAVAATVLSGMRPPMAEPDMDEHLARFERLVSALPNATRNEISDLLGILSLAPGRWALAGLAVPWTQASPSEVASALQSMRTSDVVVQRQAYQALRELTIAAHFSAETSWAHLGYPGPKPL
jgi:hypothetical protein